MVDLAACVWDLVCEAYTYREDLTIIFTAHTQTDHDEAGYMFTRIKTSGKKLDKNLPGKQIYHGAFE